MLASKSRFATTRWSIVLAARSESAPRARAALETLCEMYWPALYAYLRRCGCGRDEAEDVVQGFFARLLEKGDLAKIAPDRGRFRSYLLASVKHFLANERDRARAAKRGGGKRVFSLDIDAAESQFTTQPSQARTPKAVFDRQWALTLLDHVRDTLRDEFTASGKGKRFEHLLPFLDGEPTNSHRAVAAALGITENAVMVAVHRLRQRFRDLLRAEIAQTVTSEDEINEEIRDLFQALSS